MSCFILDAFAKLLVTPGRFGRKVSAERNDCTTRGSGASRGTRTPAIQKIAKLWCAINPPQDQAKPRRQRSTLTTSLDATSWHNVSDADSTGCCNWHSLKAYVCTGIVCGTKHSIKNDIRETAHGKNDFAEAFKNLARYRSENNFIRPSTFLGRKHLNWFLECQNYFLLPIQIWK